MNKSLIRVILMSIMFLILAVSLVFAKALGEDIVTVMRLIGVACGVVSLGMYDKKLK